MSTIKCIQKSMHKSSSACMTVLKIRWKSDGSGWSHTWDVEIWTTCLEYNIPKQTISHEDICTFEHIDRQVWSITELICSEMRVRCSPQDCTICRGQMDPHTTFVKVPKIISVILDARWKITINKTIRIMNQNGRNTIIFERVGILWGFSLCMQSHYHRWKDLV